MQTCLGQDETITNVITTNLQPFYESFPRKRESRGFWLDRLDSRFRWNDFGSENLFMKYQDVNVTASRLAEFQR